MRYKRMTRPVSAMDLFSRGDTGVGDWNEWREQNPTTELPSLQGQNLFAALLDGVNLSRVNLAGADLGEASLVASDFFRANLSNADLGDANLERTHLRGANLTRSDLSQANLRRANLSRSVLSQANLSQVKGHAANLRATKLFGANLSGADLFAANLTGASLISANLRGAHLGGADFTSADLTGADLREADFSGADLSGANLGGTNLTGTLFRGTELKGSSFLGAKCKSTVFADVELTGVSGTLESLAHYGPSSIDTHTLVGSKGRIPECFLRGCGLHDWEIEASKLYDPDLTITRLMEIEQRAFGLRAESPEQVQPVLISYSKANSDFVDQVSAQFDQKHVRYWRELEDADTVALDPIFSRDIVLHPKVLVVLSEASVKSGWVQFGIDKVAELGKKAEKYALCPVMLDKYWLRAKELSGHHRTRLQNCDVLDFSQWADPNHFARLFDKLLEGLGLPSSGSVSPRSIPLI